ncbi:MAG: MbnP family protein [Bacteroidales bacterium]
MVLPLYQRIVPLILVLFFILNHQKGYSQKAKSNSIEINFSNYVGNEVLKLDSVIYKNASNQEFSVTKFKYYIANIALWRKDGKQVTWKNYYLIDEEKPDSKKFVLENIPGGEYVAVNFTIGVDSIDNCSGAQSGALDPINGMFWAWNTGYIFMKLEGTSEFSTSPNAMLEYHIGGFKKPNNCIRTISLPLKKSILITNNNNEIIDIKTDILEILKTPVNIDFSVLSSVTDFNNATTLADNYSDMFSILNLKDEK